MSLFFFLLLFLYTGQWLCFFPVVCKHSVLKTKMVESRYLFVCLFKQSHQVISRGNMETNSFNEKFWIFKPKDVSLSLQEK